MVGSPELGESLEPATIGGSDAVAPLPGGATITPPDLSASSGEPPTSPSESLPGDSPPESPDAQGNPGEAYAQWLSEQPPDVVLAEHKRLSGVPAYDSVFNKDRARRDTETQTRIRAEVEEQVQLKNEHNQVMGRNAQWLDDLVKTNPTAAARAAYDDTTARQVSGGALDAAGFRNAQNEIAGWIAQQSETPTRMKIANDVADQTLVALQESLAADPDWESVAGKFPELAKMEEKGPAAVATFIKRLADARVQRMLPGIRREEQTKAEAKYEALRADDALDGTHPDRVTAGIAGNGAYATLDQARAAHIANLITNDQMRAYVRRFGHEN